MTLFESLAMQPHGLVPTTCGTGGVFAGSRMADAVVNIICFDSGRYTSFFLSLHPRENSGCLC